MKKLLIILCFLSLQLAASAQEEKYSTSSQRAITMYERSNVYLGQKLYNTAAKELTQALAIDPNFLEARHRLADIYKIQKEYAKAKEEYLKITAVNPDFSKQTPFYLAECYFYTEDYTSALGLFKSYGQKEGISENRQKQLRKYIADCEFAIVAMKNPVPYKPVNLGPAINTVNQEYLPTVTADDSTLIFTRKTSGEDFFISYKGPDGWMPAKPLSNKINTPQNEGAQCISPDGQYLYFAGCNRPDGMGKCDIYFSRLIGNEWSAPQNLGPPVNSNYWESQPALSADGKTLFFVSDRKGGMGSYDIWKSDYLGNGKWSQPVNLGPSINTEGEELSPFMHPDNQTLYFGSDGWPGMGERDIFFSRKGSDGKWSKPTNLGYPINTCREESSLFISNDGLKAYFASNNLDGMGGMDLYSFELYPEARPLPVSFVKGFVFDKTSKQKLEANVEIIDIATGDTVLSTFSNAANGQFLASLPAGHKYALNVNRQGYLFYSDHFVPDVKKYLSPFILQVPLSKVEIGEKIALKNIFYETNSFVLRNESKFELNKLVQFMNSNPSVQVEIGGHTDNVGDDKANNALSNNRAKSVYDYLVKIGISADRLVYKGYGKSQPVDTNATEQGRANNRRTEVKITGN